MSNPEPKISESMYYNADGVAIPNPIWTTIRQMKRTIHRVDHDDEAKDQEREETNGSCLKYYSLVNWLGLQRSNKCTLGVRKRCTTPNQRRIAAGV